MSASGGRLALCRAAKASYSAWESNRGGMVSTWVLTAALSSSFFSTVSKGVTG